MVVSWQKRIESKAPRLPCGSELGLPLPHSPLQLMSQVFRRLRSHSSLPAKLFCRLKLVNDRFFSPGPPLAKLRKVFETRGPRNVHASRRLGRGQQFLSQGFGRSCCCSGFPRARQLSLSVGFYLFLFILQKITPTVDSESYVPGNLAHSVLGAWSAGPPGELALAWVGELPPIRAPWAQAVSIRAFLCWRGSPEVFQKGLVGDSFQASATLI